jgi:hypothetical protein
MPSYGKVTVGAMANSVLPGGLLAALGFHIHQQLRARVRV